MPRRLLLVLILVILAALGLKLGGVLDPAPDPTAEMVDLSFAVRERLEELRAEIGFPGATAAFVLPDGRSGRVAVGTVDPDGGAPMPLDARMLAGSVGKMFVAGVVLDLVGRGVLDLDAPVADWLGDEPWFARVPNAPDLTLRNLMNHASGVPDHLEQASFLEELRGFTRPGGDPDRLLTPVECIGHILDLPPTSAAGSTYAYTDTNYLLAGLVVEKATGRTYEDLVDERILVPLGLAETYPQRGRRLPGVVPGHMREDNPFGLPTRTIGPDGLFTHEPALEWCGGGMVSTSHDLARYVQRLYRGTALAWDYRPDLLRGPDLNEAHGPGRYGLATFLRRGDLGPTLGHTGWYPGYNTAVTHYVDHGVTVAVQVNRDWDTEVRRVVDELARVVTER